MAKHICCAVFRVVLSAWRSVPLSLTFQTATLWAFQPPLSGPPSLPKPSYSLLFPCLVFCLRPSLIRYVGSNFPIYKHLKHLPLHCLKKCDIQCSIKRSKLSAKSTGHVCLLPSHITILYLLTGHSPPFACQQPCLLVFLMHCGRFVWR